MKFAAADAAAAQLADPDDPHRTRGLEEAWEWNNERAGAREEIHDGTRSAERRHQIGKLLADQVFAAALIIRLVG